ncbi:MAG: hypothetical protein TREMPRED_000087 [Tremellales sp. Tagirdzhanova-0007]|nr:MAG: hypothetical protein TREMPRED_000087 [Tremellales sp. Tagirdzhanova-0007]
MAIKCCGKPGATCSNHPQNSSTCGAVPLPHTSRPKPTATVWTINNALPPSRERQLEGILESSPPLSTKCAVHEREDGQCCKDLKGDDERHLISPEIVRDVIIGLSDGLTVPFALTAGLSSIGSSRLVVTGGLAELCAGAISMGLGGYLASQAELDHFHYLRKQTQARVLRSCVGEMEREIHAILGPLGVKETLSRLIANDLRAVEDKSWGGQVDDSEGIMAAPARGIQEEKRRGCLGRRRREAEEENGGIKGNADMGLTAFLLKFGEGLEEVPRSRLYVSALTIGLSYFIGGLIPLIPYMAKSSPIEGLIISCVVTGVVLFLFGGFKTYFTGAAGGVLGYLYGATSTMVVGCVAAGAAFGLVKAMGVKE